MSLLPPIANVTEFAKVVKSVEADRFSVLDQDKFPPFKFFFCEEYEQDKSVGMLLYNHALADGNDYYKWLYFLSDSDDDRTKLNMEVVGKY